jgi:hypothetical protein
MIRPLRRRWLHSVYEWSLRLYYSQKGSTTQIIKVMQIDEIDSWPRKYGLSDVIVTAQPGPI